jgi:hypothetical protein
VKRLLAFAVVAGLTNFAACSYLRAEDVVTQRGFIVFAPGSSQGTYYEYKKPEAANREKQEASEQKDGEKEALRRPLLANLRESLRRRPLFFRRYDRPETGPSSIVASREAPPATAGSQPPAEGQYPPRAIPVSQRNFAARPVSYGSRWSTGSIFPGAVFGQTGPAPSQPAMTYPPSAGAQGLPADINSQKYGYAARSNGGYDGVTYYSPGPGYGYYSPVYNSGYYTSGCYEANACCRTSRRYCTPFGGMFRGCGCACYSPPPPPCPTTCYLDPCYGPMGGPTYYSPPASGSPTPAPAAKPQTPPTPNPPAPSKLDDPQPVEKKVTPEPQANLSPRAPRIPGLPPDA